MDYARFLYPRVRANSSRFDLKRCFLIYLQTFFLVESAHG